MKKIRDEAWVERQKYIQTIITGILLAALFMICAVILCFGDYHDEPYTRQPSPPPAADVPDLNPMIYDRLREITGPDEDEGAEVVGLAYMRESLNAAPDKPDAERYTGIELTDDDRDLLADIIAIEARGEPFDGQVAVAEVIFNRCLSGEFPDTVREVIYDKKYGVQFTSIYELGNVKAVDEQYDAIDQALSGPNVIPAEVVFFSTKAQNSNVWGRIGGHVFCYS